MPSSRSEEAVVFALLTLAQMTALINTAGNVVERFMYDPYGEVTFFTPTWTEKANTNFAWKQLHQGLRRDMAVGLDDSRARVYSAERMRWNQPDPIGFLAGDTNLYRALANNPGNYLDPSGLVWWPGKYLLELYWESRREEELIAQTNALPHNAGRPPETAPGFLPIAHGALLEGTTDGSVMIYNVLTLYQDQRAVDYVNCVIAENGGLYDAANVFAHIGVGSAYLAAGVGAWNAAGLPTFNVGIKWGGPKGFHMIYGVTKGGATTWAHAAGPELGWISIYGFPTAEVAAYSTFTGVPILFPAAAIPLAWITGKNSTNPSAFNCFTAALDAFIRGWIGCR